MAPQAGRAGDPDSPLAPFRYPIFRAIWLANFVSAVGSMLQSVAAAWAMTELTDSHLLIALVQASVAIPVLIFGVVAGVIADNYDRRMVMLVAQWAMLGSSGLLAVMAWLDVVTPLSLLVLTFAVGSGFALNGPAWQASVRLQVEPRDLPQAITLNSIAFNLARSAGPALGGVLISLWGTAIAFMINAASFLAMIVVLTAWRPRSTAPARRHKVIPAIMAGVEFCIESGPVRRILMRGLVFGIGLASFQALLPSIAKDQLQGNEVEFGLLMGAFGLGSVVTAIWISPMRRRFGSEAIVSAGSIAVALAALAIAAAETLVPAVLESFVAGCGFVAAMTSLNVAMQLRSPDAILGRCMAIFQSMVFGGMALGAWAWGSLSDWQGLPATMVASACWLLATLILFWLFAPMPRRGEGVPQEAA